MTKGMVSALLLHFYYKKQEIFLLHFHNDFKVQVDVERFSSPLLIIS